MSRIDLQDIPASACCMAFGEMSVEASGANAKSRKIKIKARSGQPIEHFYWGRVVHDLSGMRTHKNRLPIDYAHNDAEVLGYLNHFDSSTGDLLASGALTPFRVDDRCSEVIYKMDQGVPYEASIFFGGDGIKLQLVDEGEVADVNGYVFDGPGVIIREWPLRGVAICPYGADSNTETKSFNSSKHFKASEWKPENETQPDEEVNAMSDTNVEAAPASEEQEAEKTVEVESVEVAEQEVKAEVVADEAAPVEAAAVEGQGTEESEEKATDEPAAEAAPVVAEDNPEVQPEALAANDPRAEFAQMRDAFGADIAGKVFATGGGYDEAKDEYIKSLESKVTQLSAQVESSTPNGATPTQFASGETKSGKSLFNTGK